MLLVVLKHKTMVPLSFVSIARLEGGAGRMQAKNTDPNSPRVNEKCGNKCEDPAGNQYVIPRPSSLGQGGQP